MQKDAVTSPNTVPISTKQFFGCEDQVLVDIYEEWAVLYYPHDDRFTESYNNRNRWEVRHRFAPYSGVDADGNWHVSFNGSTLSEAVSFGNECLARAIDLEDTYQRGE